MSGEQGRHQGDTFNGVVIGNAQIYALLLETNGKVQAVKQTMDETVKPQLAAHDLALKRAASKEDDIKPLAARVTALELRTYALLAGTIVAAFGAKGLGIF